MTQSDFEAAAEFLIAHQHQAGFSSRVLILIDHWLHQTNTSREDVDRARDMVNALRSDFGLTQDDMEFIAAHEDALMQLLSPSAPSLIPIKESA